jgi:flagellar protein FlbD
MVIALRRLNNSEFVLNADFIETLEATPDTVISLINGKKLVVKDPIEEIVRKVIKYKQLSNHTLRVVGESATRGDLSAPSAGS